MRDCIRLLIRHADRSHNWGAVPGHGRPRLKLIDHGYAFRDWGRPFSSAFTAQKRNQDLPNEIREQLEDFAGHCESGEAGPLEELLEGDVLDELVARAVALSRSAT